MKTPLILLALALNASASSTRADQPGQRSPLEQMIRTLEAAGYADIGKLSLAAGQWEGSGIKNDVWISFQVDPLIGRILSEHEIR